MPTPLLVLTESATGGLRGPERALVDSVLRGVGLDPAGAEYMGVPATTRIRDAVALRQETQEAVAARQPAKLLLLGGTAATVVLGTPRIVAVTKERGRLRWAEPAGLRVLAQVSLSPSMVLRKGSLPSRDWVRDLARDVARLVASDEPLPVPEPRYQTAGDERDALEAIEGLGEDCSRWDEPLSCDLETEPGGEDQRALDALTHDHSKAKCAACSAWADERPTAGLDPRRARIMSFGLGGRDNVIIPGWVVRESREVREALYELLWARAPLVVFHNAKFDLQFIARALGSHAPQGARVADTQLMSWLLDERPVRSMYKAHGLKDISRYRYDVPDYSFDWPRFWATPRDGRDWDELDRYHALDLHQTRRLYADLAAEMAAEPGLRGVHDGLLVPASLALAEAELRGINVDRPYLEAYRRRLDRRMVRRLAGLRAAIGDPEFNPGSPAEVEALVFDEDPGFALKPIVAVGWYQNRTALKEGGRRGEIVANRNSQKAQLEKLADEVATKRQARVLRSITAWRHDAKARETYAQALLDSSADDGRAHSSFNLAGAVTGRLSSSGPNLQNIPKRGPTADAIRRAFTPPEGWALMEADYSQLELRVAALLSRDERLAAVYRDGRDVHREVAAAMFRKRPEDIDYLERYLAKAVDFGAIYGRSGPAIAAGAEMEYFEKRMGGVKWTNEEAQDFIDRFLGGFPKLKEWMARVSEQAVADRELVTLFGRRRRFPLVLRDDRGAVRRQAFNTPIQSVASDICLSAFVRLTYALDGSVAVPLVTIHDSVLLEVRRSALAPIARQVRAIMEDMPPAVAAANEGLGIPIIVDVKAGASWRDEDMEEVET